jgi:hypothetical protein
MATDAEIQKFGANRTRRARTIKPCQPGKREVLEEAFRYFGMM